MDQYEKMRKMNELAKDLKQHGFADSSFEAIKQASQIYGEDELTQEVKHGLITSPHERLVGEGKMSDTENDRKVMKLQNDINALTDKINEMVKAINDMDARITQVAKRPVVVEKFEKHEEKSVEKPVPHEEKHDTAKAEEYANQRVGNFQSQDVAIDKMFYYGKK